MIPASVLCRLPVLHFYQLLIVNLVSDGVGFVDESLPVLALCVGDGGPGLVEKESNPAPSGGASTPPLMGHTE